MPPRRHAERPVANLAMEHEMRQLRVRLDAMETMQRRELDVSDISEAEGESMEVEGVVEGDVI
jgi:hypothetical protein